VREMGTYTDLHGLTRTGRDHRDFKDYKDYWDRNEPYRSISVHIGPYRSTSVHIDPY
jgi:hypothetical protein